jgi:hypothetical protein
LWCWLVLVNLIRKKIILRAFVLLDHTLMCTGPCRMRKAEVQGPCVVAATVAEATPVSKLL